MAEYDNRSTFVLYRNEKKREGSKDPDYKGDLTLPNGEVMELSGWVAEIKKGPNAGKKMLRGSFRPKRGGAGPSGLGNGSGRTGGGGGDPLASLYG